MQSPGSTVHTCITRTYACTQAAGFDAYELKAAEFDASTLKACGFGVDNLKAAGYNASALKAAGYDARALKVPARLSANEQSPEAHDVIHACMHSHAHAPSTREYMPTTHSPRSILYTRLGGGASSIARCHRT